MAWSGGTFSRANPTWASDASNLIGIEPVRHDAQDNDFTTGINECLNKTGQNAMTGTLSMGSNKISNLAAGTLRNDAPQVGQVQDGDFIWLGTTGGTATAQTATATPAITAYKAGQKFRALIGTGLSSTGQTPTAHTININSIGAKNIENGDGPSASSPTIGTWVAGNIIEFVYNGTNFKLMNDPGSWLNWTPNLVAPTGTVSGVTVHYAKFRKIGHQVTITGYLSFTATGVGPQIEITNPPIALATTSTAYVIQLQFVSFAGVNNVGYMYNNTGTNIAFTKDVAATNFGTSTGNTRFFYIYEGQ